MGPALPPRHSMRIFKDLQDSDSYPCWGIAQMKPHFLGVVGCSSEVCIRVILVTHSIALVLYGRSRRFLQY